MGSRTNRKLPAIDKAIYVEPVEEVVASPILL